MKQANSRASALPMRQFNEREVLQAIRLHGAPSQAEIAKLTHLKPQTVSLILSRLDKDHLLLRHPSIRGKVGQASVPISLNPDGAYAIGIQIGRRNMDALLVDFIGNVRDRLYVEYTLPDPATLFDHINTSLKSLRESLPASHRRRLHGIGVAAPLSLGGWQALLGMTPKLVREWQSIDPRARVAALPECNSLPVDFAKDTSAACMAELVNGRGREIQNFLYMFVDTFIGGGLVLNGRLMSGKTGNAGAVGSIPLALARNNAAVPAQLLSVASLLNLEALYAKAGVEQKAWMDSRALTGRWAAPTRTWVKQSARAIALAMNSAACVLDLDGIIIDGAFNRQLLEALVKGIEEAAGEYSWEGIERPAILTGLIGPDARALGGAMLPLYAQYAPDRDHSPAASASFC